MNRILALLIISLFSFASFGQYEVTVFNKQKGLMSDNVRGVWQDDDGYIWVADEVGFNRVNGDEIINYFPEEGKVINHSGVISFDKMKFDVVDYYQKKKTTFNLSDYAVKSISNEENFDRFVSYRYIIKSDLDTLNDPRTSHGLPLQNGEVYSPIKDELIIKRNGKMFSSKSLDISFKEPVLLDLKLLHNEVGRIIDLESDFGVEIITHYPKYFFTDKAYFRHKDGEFSSVDDKFRVRKIPLHRIKYIYSIVETNIGNYLIRSLTNKNLLYVNKNGGVIDEIKIEGLEHCKIIKTEKNIFIFNPRTKLLYKFYEGLMTPVSINTYDQFNGLVKSNNNTLILVTSKGENKALTVIDSSGVNSIDVPVKVGFPRMSYVDNEGNIWVTCFKGVLKLSNVGLRYHLKEKVTKVSDNMVGGLNRFYFSDSLELLITRSNDSTFFYKRNGSNWETHKISGYLEVFSRKGRNLFYTMHNRKSGEDYYGKFTVDKLVFEHKVRSGDLYQNIKSYFQNNNIVYSLKKGRFDSLIKFNNSSLIIKSNIKDGFYFVSAEDSLFVWNRDVRFVGIIPKHSFNSPIKRIYNWNQKSHLIYADSVIVDFNGLNKKIDFNAKISFDAPLICLDGKIIYLSDSGVMKVFDLEDMDYDKLKTDDLLKFVDYLEYDLKSKRMFVIKNKNFYEIEFINDTVKYERLFPYSEFNHLSKFEIIQSNDFETFIIGDNRVQVLKDFHPPFSSLKTKFRTVSSYNQNREWISSDTTLKGVSFAPDANNISIRMECITHYFPETVKYLYKLEGKGESKWIETKTDSVFFGNLDPGKYTFIFKAVNGYDIESPELSYNFEIATPWYQTWWFRTLAIVLLILLIYIFVKSRTKRLLKRQEELEQTVEERTHEVVVQKTEAEKQRDLAKKEHLIAEEQRQIAETQKHIVEEKNQEIMDSITYAKRLQEAILPPPRLVKEWLTDSFLFYRPKDIVAGDFYWMETIDVEIDGRKKTLIFFASADCTGHGVPGAMVSVVCANSLNRAVKEFQLSDPGLVLDKVSELVVQSFENSEEDIKDGMDIALCALDISSKKLYYSGANNPLYVVTKKQTKSVNKYINEADTHELIEYKATKRPIGKYDKPGHFETLEVQLVPGDAIYVFSDGFPDQFGGERGKKYKYNKFKKFLLENCTVPMEEQKQRLDKEFEEWKKDHEQLDDVCVIGVRINGKERNNFTERELEVLSCLQDGLSSKMIAEKIHIAKNTVDTYRRRLLAKTGTSNTTELLNYCMEKEII